MPRSSLLVLCLALSAACASSARCAPAFAAAVTPLSPAEIAVMGDMGVHKDGCPVAPGDLSVVTFRYWNDHGAASLGRLVVNRAIAGDVVAVMKDLYADGYQFARVAPVEAYGGSDARSMAADNTSAYNCRETTHAFLPDGSPTPADFSNHSYGLAIDVNPQDNPYFRPKPTRLAAWRAASQGLPAAQLPQALLEFCRQSAENCDVEPESGRRFLDRTRGGRLIRPDDAVVAAFKRHGFAWGGDWPTDASDVVRTDLQHFEKRR